METPHTLTACYHCGEDCKEEVIPLKGKEFCCEGCKTVFDLLDQNGMCAYYDMEGSPGAQMLKSEIGNRFVFLDLEDIRTHLVDFSDGRMTKLTLFVPNIHCSSCIWLLEHLDHLHSGVVSSQVNFLKKSVTVNFHHDAISLRQVVELLTSIGYEPYLSLKDLSKKSESNYNRDLITRLAVAGFAFGNIMLLSLPDYLSFGTDVETSYQTIFNWINLGLGTLVFAYPAGLFLKSAYKAITHKTVNIDVPLALGIFALYGRSVAEIASGAGVGYMDSLAGLIFFLLIGRWYQDRTYKALSFDRDFSAYFPMAVTRVKNGVEESVALQNIKKGDELIILSNGLIPADAVLVSEHASIDYSFVTGESEPISKHKNDALFAGGRQVGGAVHVVLTKEVSQSYLTSLWDQDVFKKERKSLVSLMDNVARRFTISILIIATIAAGAWLFIDASRAVDVFTAVLIISCPCALALTMPFALGNGIRILGRNGLFLKDSTIIERLASITTIIFDKTGTLTTSERPEVQFSGELTPDEAAMVHALAANSSHPLSRALSQHLKGLNYSVNQFEEVANKGLQAVVKGIPLRIGSAEWVGSALPVAETHGSLVYVQIANQVKGYFSIRKQYRIGLEEMFAKLSPKFGLQVLSGDNDRERNFLAKTYGVSDLFFAQSPFDKLHHVKHQQDQGKQVLMVGDGLNDAGALKQADIGFSVVEDVHGFSPSCDGILEADALAALPRLMQFSKACIRIVKWSFVVSFLYNFVGVSMAVQGLISPLFAAILMPLSSITIIAFSTLGTGWMAHRNGFK